VQWRDPRQAPSHGPCAAAAFQQVALRFSRSRNLGTARTTLPRCQERVCGHGQDRRQPGGSGTRSSSERAGHPRAPGPRHTRRPRALACRRSKRQGTLLRRGTASANSVRRLLPVQPAHHLVQQQQLGPRRQRASDLEPLPVDQREPPRSGWLPSGRRAPAPARLRRGLEPPVLGSSPRGLASNLKLRSQPVSGVRARFARARCAW
jgi:hypothetical protein